VDQLRSEIKISKYFQWASREDIGWVTLQLSLLCSRHE